MSVPETETEVMCRRAGEVAVLMEAVKAISAYLMRVYEADLSGNLYRSAGEEYGAMRAAVDLMVTSFEPVLVPEPK